MKTQFDFYVLTDSDAHMTHAIIDSVEEYLKYGSDYNNDGRVEPLDFELYLNEYVNKFN